MSEMMLNPRNGYLSALGVSGSVMIGVKIACRQFRNLSVQTGRIGDGSFISFESRNGAKVADVL